VLIKLHDSATYDDRRKAYEWHNQIQIDELHAEDIFMYFGIPRTHLQYVNINAAWNDSDHLI
jgi:hypothetical protein